MSATQQVTVRELIQREKIDLLVARDERWQASENLQLLENMVCRASGLLDELQMKHVVLDQNSPWLGIRFKDFNGN